jgi:hypothetical protein
MSRIMENNTRRNPWGPLFGLWSTRYLDLWKLVKLKMNPAIKAIYERFPSILPPGSSFPDITLRTVDGSTFRSADYRGKKHLAIFAGAIT